MSTSTSRLFGALVGTLIMIGQCTAGLAAVVLITPSEDNTIASGFVGNSNGQGNLFSGQTQPAKADGVLRALMKFDIADSIPAGATINSVTLELDVLRDNTSSAATFALHALSSSWGEGASEFNGGHGAVAATGDATWDDRFFNTSTWNTPGGDFASATSGTLSIGTALGDYTFASQPGMVSNVQSWLSSSATNDGWIMMVTTEGGTISAREFGSLTSATKPTLTVTYTPAVSGSASWLSATSGSWSVGTNWSTGTPPNGVGQAALLNPATTSEVTVTLNEPVTLGKLLLGNTASASFGYLLTGSGSNTLTLNNSGSGATIAVSNGSHDVAAPLVLADNLTVTGSGTLTVEPGGRIAGIGKSLTMSGNGRLILTGTDTFTGGTLVTAGTLGLDCPTALAAGTSLAVGARATSLFGPAAEIAPQLQSQSVTPVPEPSTLALLVAGLIAGAVARSRASVVRKRRARHVPMFKALGTLAILASSSTSAIAAVVQITPTQENSIYSEDDNSNALGNLFAGVTNDSTIRRALMMFDIADNIPAGATIDSVTLDLTQVKIGPAGASAFELHPLTSAWGAGTSDGGGTGGSPTTGDATWNFNFYNTSSWNTPGGDFAASASGTALIGTTNGNYTFASQPGMVADVQSWLDSPATNYGWLLKAADESTGVSAREFGSLGSGDAPLVTVDFTAVISGSASWLSDVSGSWTDGTKWSTGTAPSGAGQAAVINAPTTSPLTVTLDGPQTVGALVLGNSGSGTTGYTLSAGVSGTLTLDNLGGAAAITVTDGSHVIASPVILNDKLDVMTAAGAKLAIKGNISQNGGGFFLTVSNPGTLVLSGSNSYSGGTIIDAGTLVAASSTALADGTSLTVGTSATSLFGPAVAAAPLASLSTAPVTPVPEPGTLALLAIVIAAFGCLRNMSKRFRDSDYDDIALIAAGVPACIYPVVSIPSSNSLLHLRTNDIYEIGRRRISFFVANKVGCCVDTP